MPSANPQEARQNFLNALDGLMSSGKVSTTPLPSFNTYQTPARPQIDPLTFSLSDYQTKKPAPDDESWLTKAMTGISASGKASLNAVAAYTDPNYNSNLPQWLQDMNSNLKKTTGAELPAFGFLNGLIGDLSKGYKGQMDAWTDGKFGWGDVPGLGALYGLGKNGSGGADIVKNLGGGETAQKWGGLAIDVLNPLDPINILAGGGAAATKAAKVAQIAKAGEVAAEAGLNVGSKVLRGKTAAEDVGDLISNQIKNKYADDIGHTFIGNPKTGVGDTFKNYELEDIVNASSNLARENAVNSIKNVGNAVRDARKNDLFALNVPFTNHVSQGFGTKPAWLKVAPIAAGAVGGRAADDLLKNLGLADNEMGNFYKSAYGVERGDQLSVDALKHLQENGPKFGDAATFEKELLQNGPVKLNLAGKDAYVNNAMGKVIPEAENVMTVPARRGQKLDYIANYFGTTADDVLAQIGSKKKAIDKMADDIASALKSDTAGTFYNTASKMGINMGKVFDGGTVPDLAKIMEQNRAARVAGVYPESLPNVSRTSPLAGSEMKSVTSSPALKGESVANSMPKFVQDGAGKSEIGRMLDRVNPFNSRTFRSTDEFVNHAANYKADTQTKIVGQSKIAEKALQGIHSEMKDFSLKERQAVIHYIEGVFPKSINPAHLDMKKVAAVGDKLKTFLGEIGQRDLKSGTINGLLENYFPHVMRPNTDLNNLAKLNPEINGLLGKSKVNKFGQERKGFDSMAQWQDAIDSLEAAGKDDLANELKQLFVNDPTEAAGFRAYKSIRSSAYSDLYAKLEKDGLLHKMDKPELHQSGKGDSFRKLTEDEAKALGLPADTVMHKDVIKGMQDLHDMFTTEGMNHAWKVIGAVNGLWKSAVTALPSHHINNLVGNVAVNTMAGVKPTHYFEAMKMLKAGDSPLIKEAIERGVISQGFISDFAHGSMVKSPFPKPSDGKFVDGLNKASEKIRNSEIKVSKVRIGAKPMTELGEKTDDFSRFALFLHGMERTGSVEKATAMVRKYLFNYSEITHADRIMKQVFPFWNWIKNNVPLQLKAFAQHQGFFQTKNKIQNTMNEDVKDGNPAYKTEDYIHIPGTDKGMPLRLPQNDLQMIGNPAHMAQQLGASLSPIWKTPIEMGMNKQFFNNAPVWKTNKGATDDSQAMDIVKYLANQLGGVGKVSQLLQNTMDDKPGSTPLLDFLRGISIGNTTTYK